MPSDPSDSTLTPSKAGITLTPDGQRVIPASFRADGSARREIRVRPGYKPPEDVEVYKNRNAEAWKNRGSGGVPGAILADFAAPGDPAGGHKNAKRRAARKKAKEREKDDEFSNPPEGSTSMAKPGEPSAEDREKQAKAIRKKIRQANELKSRRDGGENLLPEQLEKVIKMSELVRQLNALGFEQ
jgi:partner of Y14 and mago protein